MLFVLSALFHCTLHGYVRFKFTSPHPSPSPSPSLTPGPKCKIPKTLSCRSRKPIKYRKSVANSYGCVCIRATYSLANKHIGSSSPITSICTLTPALFSSTTITSNCALTLARCVLMRMQKGEHAHGWRQGLDYLQHDPFQYGVDRRGLLPSR